jgi:hypothetical protein
MRNTNSMVNETRIVAGLRKTELVNSQAALLLGGRNRRVDITDERVCGVCHKRLGGSVVAVLPDKGDGGGGGVVHYGCLGRAGGRGGPRPPRTWTVEALGPGRGEGGLVVSVAVADFVGRHTTG